MSTFVFDVQGTLVNNPSVSDEDVRKMLVVLRASGHRLILMSGMLSLVPHHLTKLVDECLQKPLTFKQFDKDTVVFDDDMFMLQAASHHVKVVHASQMGEWIANEGWNGRGRQDATA